MILEVVALKKKYIIIISAIVCVLLLLSGFLIFRSCDKDEPNTPSLPQDSNAADWNGNQNIDNYYGENAPGIAIPGFDSLMLVANQTHQKVNFHNPEKNDCLFLIGLYINDKLMWESNGYIAPGKGYYNIELTEELPEGNYVGYLYYRCFYSNGTELNSAKVELNVIVR